MINLTDCYEDFPIIIKTISDKGYQIWKDEWGEFWAEKDGWDFVSSTPAGLLGIITIYETVNPITYHYYWWKENIDDD